MKYKPRTSRILSRLGALLAAAVFLSGYGAVTAATVLADPTASSQQFFGFSGSGGSNSVQPASCDISKLKAQNQALLDQMAQLNDQEQAQLKSIEDQQKNLKPGDEASGAALDAQQKEIMDSTQSQLAALKSQEDQIHAATQGPSDQCKKDLVGQTISDMQSMVSAMNGGSISTAMDKVDSLTTEVQNLEPKLAQSGVNSTDMATIKDDVKNVQTDSKTLRGFFTAMSAQASSFIAQAQADPLGTYDQLSSGKTTLGRGLANSASSAADNLVSSFTSMVNLFDKLSGTTGGQ